MSRSLEPGRIVAESALQTTRRRLARLAEGVFPNVLWDALKYAGTNFLPLAVSAILSTGYYTYRLVEKSSIDIRIIVAFWTIPICVGAVVQVRRRLHERRAARSQSMTAAISLKPTVTVPAALQCNVQGNGHIVALQNLSGMPLVDARVRLLAWEHYEEVDHRFSEGRLDLVLLHETVESMSTSESVWLLQCDEWREAITLAGGVATANIPGIWRATIESLAMGYLPRVDVLSFYWQIGHVPILTAERSRNDETLNQTSP